MLAHCGLHQLTAHVTPQTAHTATRTFADIHGTRYATVGHDGSGYGPCAVPQYPAGLKHIDHRDILINYRFAAPTWNVI